MVDVRDLGVFRQIPNLHVLEHSLAKWGHGRSSPKDLVQIRRSDGAYGGHEYLRRESTAAPRRAKGGRPILESGAPAKRVSPMRDHDGVERMITMAWRAHWVWRVQFVTYQTSSQVPPELQRCVPKTTCCRSLSRTIARKLVMQWRRAVRLTSQFCTRPPRPNREQEMAKRRTLVISRLYCETCFTPRDIPRKRCALRAQGHVKSMFCAACHKKRLFRENIGMPPPVDQKKVRTASSPPEFGVARPG